MYCVVCLLVGMALALRLPPWKLPSPSTKPTWSGSCSCSANSQLLSSPSQLTSSSPPRPAVILPGLGNNTSDYQQLVLTLQDYGVPTVVANVARIDWLRNAAGLLDPKYWSGTLEPRPVLDWYLKRVDEAISEAKELAQGGTLSLIGHSAGGWLARVYLEEYGFSDISLLLTLGSPLLPPPKGLPGVIDQTRGLLSYVEHNCAKAVYTPELRYVCIAGRHIQGARLFANAETNSSATVPVPVEQPASEVMIANGTSMATTSTDTTFRARFIDVWGDGVVPQVSAHLDGALNISLDGVYHSPVGSDDESRPWYGSPSIGEKWINHLLH